MQSVEIAIAILIIWWSKVSFISLHFPQLYFSQIYQFINGISSIAVLHSGRRIAIGH